MAFSPYPLPQHIGLSPSLIYVLDEATRAVATLAGVGETIPNPHLLIRPFVRREAVLSSKIEGTQASISDLFLFESSKRQRARGDVLEVLNYVGAFDLGIELLDDLPICVRLVNKMHERLMRHVGGAETRPGDLRTGQVWIGPTGTPIEDARYIPPLPNLLQDLLADWEVFINESSEVPPLIKCAMMHYQFEAIHPYADGNGRIGRLLVILYLCATGILPKPLLYLSAYFERDKDLYYDQLYQVSATGEWEPWLKYFLIGCRDQALDALARTRRMRELLDDMRHHLQDEQQSANAMRLLEELFARPFMTAPLAADLLAVSVAGARGVLDRLARLGIVELREGTWPKLYVASDLLTVIEAPTAKYS